MLFLKTILHPTDFSEPSDLAFRFACSLASDYGANLVLLHVMSPPVIFGERVILPSPEDCQEEICEELSRLEVPDRQVGVVRRVEEGNPASEILQMARLAHADLIVMGTHGRRGVTRLLMGSVAEEVVRKANCPVLTVRAPGLAHSLKNAGHAHEAVASAKEIT